MSHTQGVFTLLPVRLWDGQGCASPQSRGLSCLPSLPTASRLPPPTARSLAHWGMLSVDGGPTVRGEDTACHIRCRGSWDVSFPPILASRITIRVTAGKWGPMFGVLMGSRSALMSAWWVGMCVFLLCIFLSVSSFVFLLHSWELHSLTSSKL